MIDVIGFDADDTLWHNEIIYHQAKDQILQLLKPYQSPETIEQRLDEIEIGNLRYYGYGIKSFGLSMVEAVVDLSNGRISGEELREVIEIVKWMLRKDVELDEYVEETLAVLSSRHDLMLITKGDLFEQERKIKRSGLDGHFRFIEVVGEKTQASYRRVLEKYAIDPARFLMVGNSLRSDILPVLRIGGRAVYIPHDLTWSHEKVEAPEGEGVGYDELANLGELPGYLERLFGGKV